MPDYVIETQNLTKVYPGKGDGFLALDKLNLQVERGEIFGYLGPNGAGKSTTIRMFTDLIRPTEGSATILGYDSQRDSVKLHKHIGFLPGELSLWKNETSINIVRYFARIHGNVDMNYVRSLADQLQFDMSKKIREYSTGNKRKLGIILALMHKPELLILDEPTSGLDPLMQQTFNRLMKEVRAEGRTVFLSSHVLSEVQAICDRVGVLRKGVLRAVERVDKLTHADFRWVTLTMRDTNNFMPQLMTVHGVSDVEPVNGESIKMRLQGDFDPLLKAIHDRYVVDIEVQEPSLEEIFLAYYDEDKSTQEQRQPEMA